MIFLLVCFDKMVFYLKSNTHWKKIMEIWVVCFTYRNSLVFFCQDFTCFIGFKSWWAFR